MAETIISQNASEQFKSDYLRYALYVTYKRILTDFRDGLKPIQRKILYCMYNDTKAIDYTVKSSAVVGDVMKLYSAHGSSYPSFKPLTNWFEINVPLIDHQGSFGNLEGHDASADRYTEVKLSKFAIDNVIGDLALSRKTVNWDPNYTNSTIEPRFLPAIVPLLLINGSFGIGVGLKADIPPHNLAEVIDATIYLLHNPEGQITLIPDFPLKCEIYDNDWATCQIIYSWRD